MSSSEEPDSPPALSASTAALLQQFLAQKAKAKEDAADDPFQENWALSQFWYTEETAGAVAAEAVKLAAGGGIACLACPSLFRRLRTHYPKQPAHLLEYDSRFEVGRQWNFAAEGCRRPCAKGVSELTPCTSFLPMLPITMHDDLGHRQVWDAQVLGDFTLYDYNEPLSVPEVLHQAFEVVVADPPYLVCTAKASRACCMLRCIHRLPES